MFRKYTSVRLKRPVSSMFHIDLTQDTDSQDSDVAECNITESTKQLTKSYVLAVDIGLINSAVTWYERESKTITDILKHKIGCREDSNYEIAKSVSQWVADLVQTCPVGGQVSLVVIEQQIQQVGNPKFGYSKAGTWNIVIETALHASFHSRGVETLAISPLSVAAMFSLGKKRQEKKQRAIKVINNMVSRESEESMPACMTRLRQQIIISPSVETKWNQKRKKDDLADSMLTMLYFLSQ